MENLFNQLAKNSKGTFTFETKNNFFDIEINVSFFTSTIEVKYYKGSGLMPYKKDVYSSLHGMFGADSLESKFEKILNNL